MATKYNRHKHREEYRAHICIPMSESGYYILLSLLKPRHGYGIILHIKEITRGRLTLGAGTIYGSLSKFESYGLIEPNGEEERRKIYTLTSFGKEGLETEIIRLGELYSNGKEGKNVD